MIQSLKTWDL